MLRKDEMNVFEMFTSINAGGVVAVLVILTMLIEVAPIKVSPLQWLGRRLNKETLDRVAQIEKKLDNHIAQSLRTKILAFQDDILGKKDKTREQWKEVVNAITTYERYCEDNHIDNGLCKQASQFLLTEYQNRLQSNNF